MELLYQDSPIGQYLSECGIEEEGWTPVDGPIRSTTDLNRQVNTEYRQRTETTATARKQGRRLVHILRLLKSILEPPQPLLEFQVTSLASKDGAKPDMDPVCDFADRIKYLIITSSPFSSVHANLTLHPPLDKSGHMTSGFCFRALAPQLFLYAGVTSVSLLSQLQPHSPWRSLPSIFFAGFIISLGLAKRTPEEELALNQSRLLREIDALLTDSVAFDMLLEQAMRMVERADEELSKRRQWDSATSYGSLPLVPDPLIMPAFARQQIRLQQEALREPLTELRECLYSLFAQAQQVFDRAMEALAPFTLSDELTKLEEMYVEEQALPVSPLPDLPPEPSSPIYNATKTNRRPMSTPTHAATAASRRQSWSPSLLEHSPINSSPLSRPGSARRRDSIRVLGAGRDRSSLPPLQDVTNRTSLTLLPSPSHTPTSQKSFVLEQSLHRKSRFADADAWMTSPKRASLLSLRSPSPLSQDATPRVVKLPNKAADPFSASSLALAMEKMQRSRRKMLCHYLALDFAAVYPDTKKLCRVVRVVRELKDATAYMEQDIKQGIQLATADEAHYPGAWPAHVQPQRPELQKHQSETAGSTGSPWAARRDSKRSSLVFDSSDKRDFAPPPFMSTLHRKRAEYGAYEKKTWLMGEELRSVALKLNTCAELLKQRTDNVSSLSAQGQGLSDDGSESVASLLSQHDSIRHHLEGLIRNWDESRWMLRNLVDAKKTSIVPSSTNCATSAGLSSSLLADTSSDTSTSLRASTSAGTQTTELTTPDSVGMPMFADSHDLYKHHDDLFQPLESPYAPEEVYETTASTREATLNKLTREERIKVMKERRAQEQVLSLDSAVSTFETHQPMLSELKDVISHLRERRRHGAAAQ